jgi:DNA polymerase-3 subunit delta
MSLRPDQLAGRLARGDLAPAWLVAGREPLLVLEAADAIRVAARAQGIGEREVFDFEGRQAAADWDAVAATLNAPSLFSGRRLIELRVPSGKPDKAGERIILDFCATPPPDVVLMVVAGDWSKRHGGKWAAAIEQVGASVVCWEVKPHELAGWIDRRLRSRGLQADREAVALLAERVDGNLLAAAQEVEKLVLLSESDRIDVGRMAALVADSARFNVFRLMEVVLNGQPAQAVRMLHGLRGEGEAVPGLMGMVVKELETAASVARAHAGGQSLPAAFRARGVWDTKQPMYRRALERHPARAWSRFLADAGAVDRIAKGRGRPGEPDDAWLALERLLLAVADADVATRLGRTA